MKEFLDAMELALTGFPPVLLNILTSMGGAAVSVIIAVRMSSIPVSLSDVAGQFLVCWLTGGIMGPSLFAPVVQSIANKIPDYAICFLSSGIGWWFWTTFVPKRQNAFLNHPTGDPADKPPGDGSPS